MAHILNLVGDDFVKGEFYKDVDIFVHDIKNIFKRQPQRKKRFVDHMAKMENLPEDIARTLYRLNLVLQDGGPGSTLWNIIALTWMCTNPFLRRKLALREHGALS